MMIRQPAESNIVHGRLACRLIEHATRRGTSKLFNSKLCTGRTYLTTLPFVIPSSHHNGILFMDPRYYKSNIQQASHRKTVKKHKMTMD